MLRLMFTHQARSKQTQGLKTLIRLLSIDGFDPLQLDYRSCLVHQDDTKRGSQIKHKSKP